MILSSARSRGCAVCPRPRPPSFASFRCLSLLFSAAAAAAERMRKLIWQRGMDVRACVRLALSFLPSFFLGAAASIALSISILAFPLRRVGPPRRPRPPARQPSRRLKGVRVERNSNGRGRRRRRRRRSRVRELLVLLSFARRRRRRRPRRRGDGHRPCLALLCSARPNQGQIVSDLFPRLFIFQRLF